MNGRRRWVAVKRISLALSMLSAAPIGVGAQTLLSYDIGSAVGVFATYPDEFEDQYCDQMAGGFMAWVSGPFAPWVNLELSSTVTASVGAETCAVPGLVPLGEGEVYSRDVLDDAIPGVSFFATNLAAVIAPARGASISPRLRVGGGRLWDKRIWSWFYGIEARIRAGPGALVTGLEQWNLGIDARRETYVWHEDAPALQSSRVVRRTSRPILFRFGWEGPVW